MEEVVQEEHQYPGWYYDQHKSAYWYYDSHSHAYHLYQRTPSSPAPPPPHDQQQEAAPEVVTTAEASWPSQVAGDAEAVTAAAASWPSQVAGDAEAVTAAADSWPSWHFDERLSVNWYLCTSHLAYFIRPPPHGPPGKLELLSDPAMLLENSNKGEMHECQGNTTCFCEPNWNTAEVPSSFYPAEPPCSYQGYERDVNTAYASSSSCQADESALSLPSGWVEDFLIDWYLGGSFGPHGTDESTLLEKEHEERLCVDNELSAEATFYGSCAVDVETEVDSRIPRCCEGDDSSSKALEQENENDCSHTVENTECFEQDTDEDKRMLEAWQAQYGQVVRCDDEAQICPRAINLWNWTTLELKGKRQNRSSICLLGQLAQTSSRLHPSLQHHDGFIKTTCVCEVNLDLLKVSSGQLYRLRQPSLKYLSSVSMYDSSNPTKGWNFPCIRFSSLEDTEVHSKNVSNTAAKLSSNSLVAKPFVPNLNHQRYQHVNKRKLAVPAIPAGLRALSGKESASVEERKKKYRDRAKERRDLHGDVGKVTEHGSCYNKQELCSLAGDVDNGLEQESKRHLTAKHMLERMGWCEGESLGKRKGGLIEPLQETSNRGRAGIGWSSSLKKERLQK